MGNLRGPGEQRLTVRFRIDGVLHEMQRADRSIQDGVISRLKIMSSIDTAEKRTPRHGRISVMHDGRAVDLRVATLPTVWGEKIVMRILDNGGQNTSMNDLLFSAANEKAFKDTITRPHGMVLVTGPTGSGKSTTTDLSNGTLLCESCHHRIHDNGWEIRIDTPPDTGTRRRRGSERPGCAVNVRSRVWFIPPAHIDPARTPQLGGTARYDIAA